MKIILDNLDSITQVKYIEFKEKVQKLLDTYKETDPVRFDLIQEKIKQTNGDWDTSIELISEETLESINISQLLAYEYCLATERITNNNVSFENMAEKLFSGVQKFRIGNPEPGIDDECLYGKSLDDESAIPVTSKLYRLVMDAGAQYLDYFKKDELTGAVFIYEKAIIKGFAQDENGNDVDIQTDGIDFSDLKSGQSLLTNLRQTVFHEWTHNSEKEIIKPEESKIEYEYQGEDNKTYRNYEKVNSYVTGENISSIQEPKYIISTQKDSQGNRKKYFQDENGKLRPLCEVDFDLEYRQLDNEYCFSIGLTTREIILNKETKMHNIITEGFVEEIARVMIRAIAPEVTDIDDEKYPEYVEIAKRVIKSRDLALGTENQGKTYADFLMCSTELKRDLESRIVILNDGSKVDGLHYISDYANRVQSGQTRRAQFYINMPMVSRKLNLSKAQIDAIKQSKILQKRELTEEEQKYLKILLLGENSDNQMYVESLVSDFVDILKEEEMFFDGIPEKLGYEICCKKITPVEAAKNALESGTTKNKTNQANYVEQSEMNLDNIKEGETKND